MADAVSDPLDGSVWVRLASRPRAEEPTRDLQAFGLTVIRRQDYRLQVSGWDARLLRRRLGTLLSGVDDLRVEWDATAELVRYHRDRRVAAGQDPDPSEVIADVEQILRAARPIPHKAPNITDIEVLLTLIAAAEDAYAQLITQHVEYAASVLAAEAAR